MLQELSMLNDQNASVYMILCELVCYFHISIDVTGRKECLFGIRNKHNTSSPM